MDADIALMDSKKRVTISWSGGKDSAFALHKIVQSLDYEIVHLHTVLDKASRRVGMHGVSEELLDQQAREMQLPLIKLYLRNSENNAAYAELTQSFYEQCANEGIDAVVFGDIYLEDLRSYRESLLKSSGLDSIFPLWKMDTRLLLGDFVDARFKTIICCANHDLKDQVGRVIDKNFVNIIPPFVDPCGERGEFHTFVFDGPLFRTAIPFKKGEVVQKVYSFEVTNESGLVEKTESVFWFQDLLPLIAR